jgi:chromosome segregation ATPase
MNADPQPWSQELGAKERELAADQRRQARDLERMEARLKEMGRKQKEMMERREKLTGRESQLRRQLAEMEKRYLEIGLVLPASQVADTTSRKKLQAGLDRVNRELKGMDLVNQKALVEYTQLCHQRDSLGN